MLTFTYLLIDLFIRHWVFITIMTYFMVLLIILSIITLKDRNIFDTISGYSRMGLASRTVTRWWSKVRYERGSQLKWGAFLMLFLSLLFSMGDGLISFFGWMSLGSMGFLLLYRRLERYFFIVLWLSGIYLMVLLGGFISFSLYEKYDNFFLLVLGYSILAGSFLITGYLWYFLKDRRNMIALEGTYVPMGLYFLALFLFFWSSLFAVVGWIRWADGSLGTPGLYKALYFTGELILIPTMIYLSGYPEDRFKAPHLEFMTDGGFFRNLALALSKGEIRIGKMKKRKEKDQSCPLCHDQLDREVKNCPSCDSPRFFYWCSKDEEYLVRCPNCRSLTPLGRDRCINCSIKMSNRIKCSRCGSINGVNEWISK